MTGDGAVVREWAKDDLPCVHDGMLAEHNSLARHALAQAAEIERLTRELAFYEGHVERLKAGVNREVTRRQASEARNAELLKALEDIELQSYRPGKGRLAAIRALLTDAIAAAKGETV